MQGPSRDWHPRHRLCGHHAVHMTAPGLSQGARGSGGSGGEWASPLHTGVPEDHSATLPFQVQARRPDPTIWCPEGQWNTTTVPTEAPSPRSTWRVPLWGGRTWVHVPRERGDGMSPHSGGRGSAGASAGMGMAARRPCEPWVIQPRTGVAGRARGWEPTDLRQTLRVLRAQCWEKTTLGYRSAIETIKSCHLQQRQWI